MGVDGEEGREGKRVCAVCVCVLSLSLCVCVGGVRQTQSARMIARRRSRICAVLLYYIILYYIILYYILHITYIVLYYIMR